MKKILMMILALALACSAMFVFASCDDEPVACTHADADKDHKCDSCGEDFTETCIEHVDENADGKCDYCEADVEVEAECEHVDNNKDAKCDKCGEAVACETCVDENPLDAKCDVCGKTVNCEAHRDIAPMDAKCDVCGKAIACKTHADENKDAKCDICGKTVECDVHSDRDRNAVCDVCGEELACEVCVDADKDQKCDVCGGEVACENHTDKNLDGKCDKCGADVEISEDPKDPSDKQPEAPDDSGCEHVDGNLDKKCDECGKNYIGACVIHFDRNKDFVCDYCDEELDKECKVHIDVNGDFKCDNCDIKVECNHADVNPADGRCDFCSAEVECKDCIDADGDAKCDVCGGIVECEVCVDSNGDNKCDKCEARLDADRGIEATLEAYKNSTPTKVVTNTTIDFLDLDTEREATYTLTTNRVLITGSIDGKIATVMTTVIDKIRYVSDGATDVVQDFYESIVSTEEFLQGSGSRTDGKRWKADGLNFAPAARRITPNLDAEILKRVKYYEALYNNTLTFTVAAEDVDEVFGDEKIVTDSDVRVTIVNNGAAVTSITIEYSRESDDLYPAQRIVMTTEYSYDIQKVELLY